MHSVEATTAFPHLRLTHPRVPPPASLRVSDAVTHASGRPVHEYSKCLSLHTARHSHAQLPKFKQTCSALISTISTYHSGCVRSLNLQSLSADDRRAIFLLSCCRLPAFYLFIYFLSRQKLAKTSDLPRDIVLWRAFAPPSLGIQQDYTVIISISILYDSVFHVRDLRSCFINSA